MTKRRMLTRKICGTTGFVLVALLIGCTTGHGDAPARERTIEGSRDSIEALAGDFLQALSREDRQQLKELALSKRQFVDIVWPHLPAARPGTNLTSDYVWSSLHIRSLAGLDSSLGRYGGASLQFVGYDFEGKTTDYGPFQVHRETVLEVIENGKAKKARFFGSVFEMNGEFKIFSFVL